MKLNAKQRLSSLALAAVVALPMVACSSDDESATSTETAAPATSDTDASGSASASSSASATEAADEASTTTLPAESPTTDKPAPTDAPDALDSAGFPVTIEHAYGTTEIPSMPTSVVSASGTLTGHLLNLGVPVTAAQTVSPQSPIADDNGFLLQWGDVAAEEGVLGIPGPEISIESIAAAGPDLIVGSSFGGDAVSEEVYGLLSEIAPTLVLDYSAMEWQELATILGEVTGQDDAAQASIDAFDEKIAAATAQLDATKPVVAGVISPEGINVFTSESAHGKLIESLGLTLVSPEGGSFDSEAGAGTRADVVSVSPELVEDQFGDASVLFILADQAQVDDAITRYPTLGALPAADEGRLVPMGAETFRLDRYSAEIMVDRLVEALGN